MRITVIGRGNVGGGLGRRWEAAGHEVTALGRQGGDATGSDVVLVAVPGGAIAAALAKVRGLQGQVAIDATNTYTPPPSGYNSLAHQVKSIVGGPTAKAFTTNFAALYDAIDAEQVPPGNLFVSDPQAREVTERLSRDAGFEPLYMGDLSQAALLESMIRVVMGVARSGYGPFFYHFTRPGKSPR